MSSLSGFLRPTLNLTLSTHLAGFKLPPASSCYLLRSTSRPPWLSLFPAIETPFHLLHTRKEETKRLNFSSVAAPSDYNDEDQPAFQEEGILVRMDADRQPLPSPILLNLQSASRNFTPQTPSTSTQARTTRISCRSTSFQKPNSDGHAYKFLQPPSCNTNRPALLRPLFFSPLMRDMLSLALSLSLDLALSLASLSKTRKPVPKALTGF